MIVINDGNSNDGDSNDGDINDGDINDGDIDDGDINDGDNDDGDGNIDENGSYNQWRKKKCPYFVFLPPTQYRVQFRRTAYLDTSILDWSSHCKKVEFKKNLQSSTKTKASFQVYVPTRHQKEKQTTKKKLR